MGPFNDVTKYYSIIIGKRFMTSVENVELSFLFFYFIYQSSGIWDVSDNLPQFIDGIIKQNVNRPLGSINKIKQGQTSVKRSRKQVCWINTKTETCDSRCLRWKGWWKRERKMEEKRHRMIIVNKLQGVEDKSTSFPRSANFRQWREG